MKQKKKTIRLTESDLHRIIMESAKKLLRKKPINEVELSYGLNNSVYRKYAIPKDPDEHIYDDTFEDPYYYEESGERSNEIKEDYVELARRLERLTNCEWRLLRTNDSHIHSAFRHGDYVDDKMCDESLNFICYAEKLGYTREEMEALKDKAASMVKLFFNKNARVISYCQNGYIVIIVYFDSPLNDKWNVDSTHPHSRNLNFGRNYVGYNKDEGTTDIGYAFNYDGQDWNKNEREKALRRLK
jgi:hypothetical protein